MKSYKSTIILIASIVVFLTGGLFLNSYVKADSSQSITKIVNLVYVFSDKNNNWSKEVSQPVKLTASNGQSVTVTLPTFKGYDNSEKKAQFTLINGLFVQDTQVVYIRNSESNSSTNLRTEQVIKQSQKAKNNKDSKSDKNNKAPNGKYLKKKSVDKKMIHVGKKPKTNLQKDKSDDPQTGVIK